ncbi:hypothetical protein [Bacillus sp. FSL L8-0152]|uniref:hypothetical protein n=1 Tax=Bacillus sp. FSL L8-0152 TaxID=2921516 RepID=UPI0030F790D5
MSENKSKSYGKQVIMLSKTFASNQLCNNSEYKNKKLENLSIRERNCLSKTITLFQEGTAPKKDSHTV